MCYPSFASLQLYSTRDDVAEALVVHACDTAGVQEDMPHGRSLDGIAQPVLQSASRWDSMWESSALRAEVDSLRDLIMTPRWPFDNRSNDSGEGVPVTQRCRMTSITAAFSTIVLVPPFKYYDTRRTAQENTTVCHP